MTQPPAGSHGGQQRWSHRSAAPPSPPVTHSTSTSCGIYSACTVYNKTLLVELKFNLDHVIQSIQYNNYTNFNLDQKVQPSSIGIHMTQHL